MSKSLSVTVYTSSGETSHVALLANPVDLKFSHSTHGCDSCTVRYRLAPDAAMSMVSSGGVYHVVVSAYGANQWAGRAEQVAVVDDGVEIVALGYWRALLDQPYTALWSDTKLGDWIPIDPWVIGGRLPTMYSITQTNDQILMSLSKNTTYATGTDICEFGYQIPSGSSRQITAIYFDWTANLPTNWYARVDRYDSAYTFLSTATTFLNPDDGALSTGTVNISVTACDRVHVLIFYGGAGTHTHAGESGVLNLRITNIRVRSTTSSVTPNSIISDMIPLAPALSASIVSTANSLDLTDAVFEDEYPGNIIDYLCKLGDTTGNRWESGVDANRTLYYRVRGTNAKEWYADILDLDFARDIGAMWNSVYAVYKQVNTDLVKRGTASTDTTSVNTFGLTRQLALPVETTANVTADYHRDVALADRKYPAVKTQLRVALVGSVELWNVRAGDYINIRNLPPFSFNSSLYTRFRIARSEYDATNNTLTLQSEAPLSQLEFIIGQGFDSRPRLGAPSGGIRRPDPAGGWVGASRDPYIDPVYPDYDANGNIPIRW